MKRVRIERVFGAFVFVLLLGLSINSLSADTHPKLVLKSEIVRAIMDNQGKYKLLKSSVSETIKLADKALSQKISVPVPKDPAGGYTHEKHKQNAIDMETTGLAYQLTGEKKYALFVGEMLKKYAALYPTLGIHPEKRNKWAGKLFWQGLNEAVWMVSTLQAYDAVYETLTNNERELIEYQLFIKVVDFFLEYRNAAFDQMSNHGTWAIAAVGMAGIVLNKDELVEISVNGSGKDKKSGFLKQLDTLFSPDGYYAEGPYYQRYAMLPFMLFAQALEYNRPELKIMKYRNGILLKAVATVMQMTSESGEFFAINDALKSKDFRSTELVPVLDIAYLYSKDRELLDIANLQKQVSISEAGLEVAKAIEENKTRQFVRKSMFLSDGADGTKGGIGLMRQGYKAPSVLYKFATQGMGHGHFDRLSFILFDQGLEILGDYGAARFVNVATKDGGRYLPENESWAKQSIAHNTMVVNETSHFNCNLKEAEKTSPQLLFFDVSKPDFQIFSAVDSLCYEGIILHRTLILINKNKQPTLLDIFNCRSDNDRNTYDYALHYQGQPTDFSFGLKSSLAEKKAMGTANGYQHLWIDAIADKFEENQFASFTFLENQKFYTVSTTVDKNSTIYFTELGANDPNFNLRNERGVVVRNSGKKDQLSFTAIEPHGKYISSREYSRGSEPEIKKLQIVYKDNDKAAFRYHSGETKLLIMLCLNPKKVDELKEIEINGKKLIWKGWYESVTE